MAGRVDLVVSVWREWGVQVLVLLSLALQVILLITAEIRRVKDSGIVRAVVWSAYLLADSTAIYVLGHMSMTSSSPEQQLMVFWAPFLLLHLGGQDNITAYAIEDNRLWLRHLQLLLVQVAAVAYVIYESSIMSTGSWLSRATILMFVVGVLKYGERVWVLRCASASREPGNYPKRDPSYWPTFHMHLIQWRQDTEVLLQVAHYLLYSAKSFMERPTGHTWEVRYGWDPCEARDYLFMMVEMQLSLIHDILYSKAELVHNLFGVCVRIFWLASIASAFVLFHRSAHSDYSDSSRTDLAVTYALLVGAIVLETTSLLRAMFSSWVIGKIGYFGQVVFHLRRLVLPEKRRWWSESMGQHNLFDVLKRRKAPSSRIAKLMRFEDRWNTMVHSRHIPVSPKMKHLLVDVFVKLSRDQHRLEEENQVIYKAMGLLSEGMKMDQSIMVWHLATEVYLRWYKDQEQEANKEQQDLVEAIQALSNYMLFLFVARPYMLPGFASRAYYAEMCHDLAAVGGYNKKRHGDNLRLLRVFGCILNKGVGVWRNYHLPKKETLDRGSQLGAKLTGEEYVEGMKCRFASVKFNEDVIPADSWELKDDVFGIPVADRLELIAEVWSRMLFDAACSCGAYAHAKQLSNGGELLTIAALLMAHRRSSVAPAPILPSGYIHGTIIYIGNST